MTEAIGKAQLAEILRASLSYKITKTEAKNAIDVLFRNIAYELEGGNEVRINGFGIFRVEAKSERQGRNPATGEQITVAARRAVKFKPSATLIDR